MSCSLFCSSASALPKEPEQLPPTQTILSRQPATYSPSLRARNNKVADVSASHFTVLSSPKRQLTFRVEEESSKSPVIVIHPSPATPLDLDQQPPQWHLPESSILSPGRSDSRKFTEQAILVDQLQRRIVDLELEKKHQNLIFSHVNHEIRVQVGNIVEAKQLIPAGKQQEGLPNEFQLAWNSMNASAEQLFHITNNSLDLAKILQGKLELEQIDFTLSDFLGKLKLQFTPKLKTKNLKLNIELPPSFQNCLIGDHFRLNQILSNFISNAIKFTDKGTITVKIEELDTTSRETTFRFSVIDTGRGLTAAAIRNLCTPFVQESASTAREFGGTGLGLYISKLLIKLFNQKHDSQESDNLEITSDGPGKGSSFAFNATFGLGSAQKVAPKKEHIDLPHMNILAIDDDGITQKIYQKMILGFNSTPQIASNADEAYQVLFPASNQPESASSKSKENKVDVVILDFNLGKGGTGVTVARHIRQRSSQMGKEAPLIIACSGNNLSNDLDETEKHLFDGILQKPISRDLVIKKLQELRVANQ